MGRLASSLFSPLYIISGVEFVFFSLTKLLFLFFDTVIKRGGKNGVFVVTVHTSCTKRFVYNDKDAVLVSSVTDNGW